MDKRTNNNAPNMLMEWSLLNNTEDGFIKLYVEEENETLHLCLLTTALPVIPLKVNLCLNQLAQLSVDEAWELYKRLIDVEVTRDQIIQEIWSIHKQQVENK